jgi:hypothetical protein
VVANETDSAEDAVRATINIYRRGADAPAYPTVVLADDQATGAPLGWGALSGLVADPGAVGTVYVVSDSYYGSSRIYTLDVSTAPARIVSFVDLKQEGKPVAYDLEGIALKAGGGFWMVSEGDPESKNPLTTQNLLLAVAADGMVQETIALPKELARAGDPFRPRGRGDLGRG